MSRSDRKVYIDHKTIAFACSVVVVIAFVLIGSRLRLADKALAGGSVPLPKSQVSAVDLATQPQRAESSESGHAVRSSKASRQANQREQSEVSTEADWTPLALPETGKILDAWNWQSRVAPLSIAAPVGATHYFVKLIDCQTGKPVFAFFIRGGDVAKLSVPVGTYEIRYAAGTTWYGTDADRLFGQGSKTTTRSIIPRYVFARRGEGYTSHSIEFSQRLNGRVPASPIPRDSF